MRVAFSLSVCVMICAGGAGIALSQSSQTPTEGKAAAASTQVAPGTSADAAAASSQIPPESLPQATRGSLPGESAAQSPPSPAARRRLARQQYKCMKNCMGGSGGLSYEVCAKSCF